MQITKDDWINAVDALLKSAGKSPHRPLLLLLMLKRARDGKSREISFLEAEAELSDALDRLGSAKRPDVLLPFWHLQSSPFWEVIEEDKIPRRKGKDRPTRGGLVAARAVGAIKAAWWSALAADHAMTKELCQKVADELRLMYGE